MEKKKRYLHYAVFAALMLATGLGWNWAWGILFIFWTIPAFYLREVHFIDAVRRDDEPVFYWLIMAAWLILGITMILMSIPSLYPYFYPEFYG